MTRTKTRLEQIDVVSHAQQHGLPALRLGRAPRRLRRQLPLHGREDALDLRSLTIAPTREAATHLRPGTLDLPVGLAALRGDDAVGPDDVADVSMVTLAVEFGIGQHLPDGRDLMRGANERAQGRAVVVGPLPRGLSQHAAAQDIDDYRPLASVPPRQPLSAVGAPVDEEGADRAGRQPRRGDGHDGLLPLTASTAGHDALSDGDEHLVEHRVGDAAHEAVERRMIRRPLEAERPPQVGVLREADFGLPEGPVLEAHQAEDRHQLRLRECVLGVLAAVGRQDFLHDFQRSLCKEHQTDFSHTITSG